jgi:fucose permease
MITKAVAREPVLEDVIAGAYLAMFTQGIALNITGLVLPLMALEFGQTPESMGLIFTIASIGFLAGTVLANPVARRIGLRGGLALGSLVLIVGLIGLMVLPHPWIYLAAAVMSLGISSGEVMLNQVIEPLAADRPGTNISRLHAMWGIGAITASLLTAGLVALGAPWRILAVVALGLSVVVIVVLLRGPDVRITSREEPALPTRALGVLLPFGLVFFTYVGMEAGTSGWVTTFFSGLGQGVVVGALASAAFFLLFTILRWFASGLGDRFGLMRVVRTSLVVAVIGLALTIWEPVRLPAFALAGAGMSLVFPTFLVWGVRRHPDLRPELNATAVFSAGAAVMSIPYLIGQGVAVFGLLAFTPLLILVALVALGATFLAR